jgi:2-polyprenyl-6-methoxyphenol hydroxylase-like FAD-dependent oxidoreductase
LAARQCGFDVTIADGAVPPIDKPCGEGLMPDGIEALQALGVHIPTREARPFRGIRFCGGEAVAEALFPTHAGLGIRRTQLHRILVESAAAAGVRMRWGSVVNGIEDEGVRMGAQLVKARWIVGADGGHSRVRRWAGLDVHVQREPRFAFRRHYRIAPWTDFMELHWGPRCQFYVTPVGGEEVCVALVSRNPKLRLDTALRFFPSLQVHLRNASWSSPERGAVTVSRRLKRVATDRVALIGDASGGVDAITGEGLCLAFRQARLLASCLAAGSLRAYPWGHRALFRRPAAMSRLMLLLDRHSRLRDRVLAVLAGHPRVFAGMVAVHVGVASPLQIASNSVALGWGLLRQSEGCS